MSVDRERAWIGELYPGRGWKKKVSKMSDSQVLAIHLRERRKQAEAKSAHKKTKEGKDDAQF